jgi:hypothetical protein
MKSSSSSASSHNGTPVSGTSGPRAIQKAWAKFTKYTGRFTLKYPFATRLLRGSEKSDFSLVRSTPLPIQAIPNDSDMDLLLDDDGGLHTPPKGHEEVESPDVEAGIDGPHGREPCESSSPPRRLAGH